MASITVNIVVTGIKPTYVSADLISFLTWLKGIKTLADALPDVISRISGQWTENDKLLGTIEIIRSKTTDFDATDISTITTWVKTNIIDTLPSFATCLRTYIWQP